MAERNETPMNELADAVLAKLKTISARKDNSFLTTPKVVKRVGVFGDFTGMQKPSLALSVVGWEVEPHAFQSFEGKLRLGVHCITENTGETEAELLRLVSDVILALAKDVTVGSQAVYLFPQSFEPNIDVTNRTGLAVTTVTFECLYRFDSTAP
jgi:hypothetical protein